MTYLILTTVVILCAVGLFYLEQRTRDDEQDDADEWWVIR